MEPRWIVGLAIYVAAEKLIPLRFHFHRWSGAILIVLGLWQFAIALQA